MLARTFVALLVSCLPLVAHAQDPEPKTAADFARPRDASIDRGFLSPHAETLGEDMWSVNSYELFMLGVTYSPIRDFEVSLTATLPIVEEFPLVVALAPKYVSWRGESTTLAVRGLISYFSTYEDPGEGIFIFGASALLDQYFDHDGRFSAHAGLTVGGAVGNFDEGVELGDGVLFMLELGLSLGVADILKIMVESQIVAANTANGGFEVADIALITYGVRFHGKMLAAELGFSLPVGSGAGDIDFILGYPVVSFSARF